MTKKIVLLCAGGMSTSLLVSEMKKEAAGADEKYDIVAYGISEIAKCGEDADVVLLGPQVGYFIDKIHQEYPKLKAAVIPMKMYGAIDSRGIMELAEKLAEEK